jgi:cyclic beta-1,2-glucan synthetase
MNRVGHKGRGESVWLGWFLAKVLRDFTTFVAARGDDARATRWNGERERLVAMLEQTWDGEWYRRAYFDDGTPLGSAQAQECRIDAISQSWAVLSGAAPTGRAERAMDSVRMQLVRRSAGLIQLLTPPFDTSSLDPGYIKGYVPGVRENGGQYTHGALWAVQALAEAGRRERAARLLEMLSPASHARSRAAALRYKVEPYVIAADVYGAAPHVGRGGWTWYTGSAGWMFRVVLETLLGCRLEDGTTLAVQPRLPAAWPAVELRWRLPDGTAYTIRLTNVTGEGGGLVRATLDEVPVEIRDGVARVPLCADRGDHEVRLELG